MEGKNQRQLYKPSMMRATLAVAWRSLVTVMRYPGWFLAQLVWPAMLPLSFVLAARALAGRDGRGLASFAALTGTTQYVSYVLAGTTFWMWLNWTLWGLGTAFRKEQLRGTLESNWLAPLPKRFLAYGALLGEGLVGLEVLVLSTFSASIFYRVSVAGDYGLFALVIIASTLSVYGFGLLFASLTLSAKEVNGFVFLARGLGTILCGTSFPIAVLPESLQNIARFVPMSHSIAALRAIQAGNGLGAIMPHLRFLLLSGAVLTGAGLAAFELVQRRMLATGTLGQH